MLFKLFLSNFFPVDILTKKFAFLSTLAGSGYAFPGVILALGTTFFLSLVQDSINTFFIKFDVNWNLTIIGTFTALLYTYICRFNAIGIENNPSAIKNCRLKKLKTYKSLNDIKQNINLISFWHSFEHVSNYKEILTQSNKLLVKDGFVLIAVPNFMSYDANHYKEMWAAYDVPRHRYHFSPAGLKSVMDNAGFDFIKKHPLLLDSYYISMLSEKYKKSKLFFLKGLIVGFVSNFSAIFTSNHSSSAFVFKKRE